MFELVYFYMFVHSWAERGVLACVRVGAETRYYRKDVLRCVGGPGRQRSAAGDPLGLADSDHVGARDLRAQAPLQPPYVSSHDQCPVHRIAELVRFGTARAAAIAATWDADVQRRAHAAVGRALRDQVAAGWSFSEVGRLVDEVVSRWDPELETEVDCDSVPDPEDDEDYDDAWSDDTWGLDYDDSD